MVNNYFHLSSFIFHLGIALTQDTCAAAQGMAGYALGNTAGDGMGNLGGDALGGTNPDPHLWAMRSLWGASSGAQARPK